MGCSTSKESSPPAASTPGDFTPKTESVNRTVTTQPTSTEPVKAPTTKEGQFELLAAKSKSPNASNYSALIASATMLDYMSEGMKEEDIRSLFDIVDADHNGSINYKEYLELLEYIDLAVAEKKRVSTVATSKVASSTPSAPIVAAPTNIDNPIKASKPVELPRPAVSPQPVESPVTSEPVSPLSPVSTTSSTIAVPEKAAEGPKRRPPSKRIVHIPTGDEPPKVATPIAATGPKVMMPFGVASPKKGAEAAQKQDTIKEGEQEEEDDDENDPNKPKQKKGFLINDDVSSADPSMAKNYYVLDNGKLKYMDHTTKQYQVIPLNNRKVQVSSDGVIELIATEEDATSTVDSAATSPSDDGRRASLSASSPRSRISLRVKNERDVDQWRAAIAEHQQYATTKEENRASMRLGTSRTNSVTSVPTETDSKKN